MASLYKFFDTALSRWRMGPAPAAMVPIDSDTVSGVASVTFDDVFTSDFDEYELRIKDVIPDSNGTSVMLMTLRDAGGDVNGPNYRTGFTILYNSGQVGATRVGTAGFILNDSGTNFGNVNAANGHWRIRPRTTSAKEGGGRLSYYANNILSQVTATQQFLLEVTTVMTGVRFQRGSGNLSGTFEIFGIPK